MPTKKQRPLKFQMSHSHSCCFHVLEKINLCRTFFNTAVYTKLIVIGGNYDGSDLNSVEVVDLENPSNTCNLVTDYPLNDRGMTVGIVDGLIKSCGSEYDKEECYDYNPSTSSWITSESLINSRTFPKSSFVDGIWLVSGDEISSNDLPLTTEMWTGPGFESGLSLPIPMYNPCQLTVNSSHVFIADTDSTGSAFLLDWNAQTWSVLPRMTVDRNVMSCGLINNPENGIEVVIFEDGVTEILNLANETWRLGPTAEAIDFASYAQIGDTFVMVGGNIDGDELDSIYKFDHINYDWILMSQRLQVPRNRYPGVVVVPDNFVNCS